MFVLQPLEVLSALASGTSAAATDGGELRVDRRAVRTYGFRISPDSFDDELYNGALVVPALAWLCLAGKKAYQAWEAG